MRLSAESRPVRLTPDRRSGALLLATVAAAWLGGCASDDPAPGRAVSVPRQPRPDRAAEPEAAAREFDAGLAEMSSAIQHGDCERGLALGDQMLAKKPPEEVRVQIERLRKVAKQQLLQSFYVDAVVRAAKDRVTIGEKITGEVTLINVGTERIVIADEASGTGPASSRTLLHLEVRYREFAPDGTVVDEQLTSNVFIGRTITLEPGARFSMPLELDTLAQNPSGTMLREYDIGGSVFLAELRTGSEVIYGQIKLKPRRVRVFPRNWEHLAAAPLARLREAVAKQSPPHVPLAAALVPEHERTEALRALRDALREGVAGGMDAATLKACCVALAVLTGEQRKPDPDAWLRRLDELLP